MSAILAKVMVHKDGAMAQFNIHEAKTKLSQLIAMAERGEEVIIARDGEPCAVLSPLPEKKRKLRVFGQFNGVISSAEIDAAFSPEAEAEMQEMFDESLNRSIWPAPPLPPKV
jgi:prevent-host-death family protein